MKNSDVLTLMLFGFNFLVAIGVFFYRRKHGSGRPTSVLVSGLTFSVLLTLGLLIFSREIIGPPRGIGLNVIIVPIISGAVCAVASVLLTLFTHVFLHRDAPSGAGSKEEVHEEVREMTRKRKKIKYDSDWRQFSANISNVLD